MNERIKELAYIAAGNMLSYDAEGDWRLNSKEVEKFAELLIQECLLALEPDPMALAIDYDVEEKFYKRSANKIKNHFEVI